MRRTLSRTASPSLAPAAVRPYAIGLIVLGLGVVPLTGGALPLRHRPLMPTRMID